RDPCGHSTAQHPPRRARRPTLRMMTAHQFEADVDQLVTGEAVALELPPASIGVRLVSGLIDMTIQVGVLIFGSFVAALLAPDEALGAVAGIVLVAFSLVVGPAMLE